MTSSDIRPIALGEPSAITKGFDQMRKLGILLAGILILGAASMFAGCGGGGKKSDPAWPISGAGRLQSGDAVRNGKYYEAISFTPPVTGYVTVNMGSPGFDCVVRVYRDYDLIGSDDDDGPGLDASFAFYATGGVTYVAHFTSYRDYATGDYTYEMKSSSRGVSSDDMTDTPQKSKLSIDEAPNVKSAR